MEKNQDITVLNFIAHCNEFIEGKYLFSYTKLESIYKSLLDSPALVELFLQCSEDFKYSLEKTKAFIKSPTKLGTFTPPQDLDKFLALVFGVLKEIDEKIINFNTFVPKYFSDDQKTPPTQRFANQIILPLKNTIAKYFEVDADNKKYFKEQELTPQENQAQTQDEKEDTNTLESTQEPTNKQVLHEETKQEDEVFAKENSPLSQITVEQSTTESSGITIEKLLEVAKEILQNMLLKVKNSSNLKPELKQDGIFVLSRAIKSLNNNQMEDFYSEIISLKYMQRKFRLIRYDIKKLLEIIDAFEKI